MLSGLAGVKENVLLLHPFGCESFGTIAAAPKFEISEGGIFLRAGVHRGPNRGFGARHIWEAHSQDLIKQGCTCVDDVSSFISSVVTHKAPVYCEFNDPRGNHRMTVLRNALGSLILEPRNDRRGFGYYVVTWYPSRQAKGTLVTKVLCL